MVYEEVQRAKKALARGLFFVIFGFAIGWSIIGVTKAIEAGSIPNTGFFLAVIIFSVLAVTWQWMKGADGNVQHV